MSSRKNYTFHLHLHFAHLLEKRLRSRLAPLGVHPRQARILDALGRMGEVSQVKLAHEFGLTAASMSTMTSRLLAAGLIKRRVDTQEQRKNVLKLTRKGNDLLEKIHREWHATDQEIVEAIGRENTALFADFARQLRNAFGGTGPSDEILDEDAVLSRTPREKA